MDCKRSSSKAFTLLELLVSMVIVSIVLGILIRMIGFTTNAWNTGNGDSERRQNARALTDFIAKELRPALLPLDPNLSASQSSQPNLQFLLNPTDIDQSNRNPSALFWQAPVATDSSGSDLAEIGYFVRWTADKVPKAQLCRFLVNPAAANYLIYSSTSWISDNILSAAAPATAQSGYIGLFAENVIGFWVRLLDSGGTIMTASSGTGAGTPLTSYDSRQTLALPYCAEISMVLLDQHSAGIITPALQQEIMDRVNDTGNITTDAEKSPADECVKKIQTSPAGAMKKIAQGARAYTVRVYLENAR
ncbi:MAG: type II secretion system protein J [Chthoniobacteraceae bacterium]